MVSMTTVTVVAMYGFQIELQENTFRIVLSFFEATLHFEEAAAVTDSNLSSVNIVIVHIEHQPHTYVQVS